MNKTRRYSRNKNPTEPASFRMDSKVLAEIDMLAHRHGTTRAGVVNALLRHALTARRPEIADVLVLAGQGPATRNITPDPAPAPEIDLFG